MDMRISILPEDCIRVILSYFDDITIINTILSSDIIDNKIPFECNCPTDGCLNILQPLSIRNLNIKKDFINWRYLDESMLITSISIGDNISKYSLFKALKLIKKLKYLKKVKMVNCVSFPNVEEVHLIQKNKNKNKVFDISVQDKVTTLTLDGNFTIRGCKNLLHFKSNNGMLTFIDKPEKIISETYNFYNSDDILNKFRLFKNTKIFNGINVIPVLYDDNHILDNCKIILNKKYIGYNKQKEIILNENIMMNIRNLSIKAHFYNYKNLSCENFIDTNNGIMETLKIVGMQKKFLNKLIKNNPMLNTVEYSNHVKDWIIKKYKHRNIKFIKIRNY